MFVPAVRARRKVAAAGAVGDNAALFRRYPKRDSKGRIEWIHWADLDLAGAWAEDGVRALDAFVAKHSAAVSDARTLEQGARATIYVDARDALLPLNNAFQALNVPPLLSLPSEEFGCANLLWSFVAIRDGHIDVRTTVLSGPSACVKAPSREAMIALKRAVAPEELASDSSVVVDVRSRRVAFRGAFDAGLAFKRNAADSDRAYLALWARKPWVIDRGDDVEFIVGEPIVWERDRVVRRVQMARVFMEQIARDPWEALVAARERVRAFNATLAVEWMNNVPDVHSSLSAVEVASLTEVMNVIASARSEQALSDARARAREGLATGAGSVAGVLGAISAVAPPAALVLAPAAAVLGAVAAIAGLVLQIIPRSWLATAEEVPPRLPVPSMISGNETVAGAPSHRVARPPRSRPSSRAIASAPRPLEDSVFVATTMVATAATATTPSTPVQLRGLGASQKQALLALSSPPLRPDVPVPSPRSIPNAAASTPAVTGRSSSALPTIIAVTGALAVVGLIASSRGRR